jgi:hypothetical protein
VPKSGIPPVERLPRIARDRDRPSRDAPERRRRDPPPPPPREDDEDDGRPHIDVRV